MKPEDFWLKKGDRVVHIKDHSWIGTVTEIDSNLIEPYGVTTCKVLWEDGGKDIVWTNKLNLLSEKQSQ